MRLLGTIIDKLPIEPGVAPLRRLTVLASHSHPNVKPEEVEEALDSGVARAARALAPLMARRLGAGSAPEEAAL